MNKEKLLVSISSLAIARIPANQIAAPVYEEKEQGQVLRKFVPTSVTEASSIRLSRKFDNHTLQQLPYRPRGGYATARVDAAYKRKAEKVRPVDTDRSDGTIPGGSLTWKKDAISKEVPEDIKNRGPYSHWLIPKFSNLARGARMTPERLSKMIVGEELTIKEKELVTEMLYNREAALAWDFSHIGRVNPDVAPPQEIRTVPHQAWQVPGFQIPKALNSVVTHMLKERIQQGIIEPCHGPYRNPWYLVKKKEKGTYRLVNAAMEMNRVTIRDANLPPSADEFSEDFAGCAIASLVDFFSGYDQIELDKKSRDLTGFMTPIGLLRMTTLPQGATNSIAQFVRIVTKILQDHIPDKARPFMDDIGVKGPRTKYDEEEAAPGIRRYVLEHIQWLDAVLADLERAGCTISGVKSQFCMAGLKIVGFVCDADGRHPESAKIIKILDWPECKDVSEIRAFIGVCVFYRIWVEYFALVAEPLYHLMKKNVTFVWGPEHTYAMDKMKFELTSPPALISIDYSPDAGAIIYAVDSSLRGWGGALMQIRGKKKHPVRYESGIWSDQERKYDATKRECRGILKALKKVRFWLYGVHFILETDANVLVAQLNMSGTDLPGALITRWIAWIRLFDFEVKHVSGSKHTAADGLSRRPPTEADLLENAASMDIDDFIDAELGSLRVSPARVSEEGERVLDESYSDKSERIATYLTTLQKPSDLTVKEFKKFKDEALRYRVQGKQLFRRNSKNVPSRRVVDSEEDRQRIIHQLHDEGGHKGREGTYRRIADRYWWENLHQEVKNYVQTCEACQKRDPARIEEALHPTWVSLLWSKIGLDVVHMPPSEGKRYLVVARDDLSGWVEARALTSANSVSVAKFVWEDVICRHGCFGKLIVDGGPENKDVLIELTHRYGIKRIVVSAYHPQANGMVERGHRPLADALAKKTLGGTGKWVRNLPAVCWSDRTTVRVSTGHTPFYLNCGYEAVLPIELDMPTWKILPWDEVHTTADLIAMRARQIQRRDEDLEEAALYLQRSRLQGKDTFDESHKVRPEDDLSEGDMILLHDTKLDNQHSAKLSFRWTGPYRIAEAINEKGTYKLSELDGTLLAGTYAGNRLKKFHVRSKYRSPQSADESSSQGTTPSERGT